MCAPVAPLRTLPGRAARRASNCFKARYPNKASGVCVKVAGRVKREGREFLSVGGMPAAEGAGGVVVGQPVVTLVRHPQ